MPLKKPRAHFLHLGKTGGSAVKAALQSRRWPSRFELRFHPHEVRLADIPSGEKVFFFVRDPAQRFVSGFLSRRRKGRPRYDVEWTAAETEAFQRFPTPESLALALRHGDEAALRAMTAIGHVKDSYWTWFGDKTQLAQRAEDILFVGITETLEKDFRQLKEKLGLPEQCLLPTDPVEAHRRLPDDPATLSHEARSAIQKWYSDDYAFWEWALNWQAPAR